LWVLADRDACRHRHRRRPGRAAGTQAYRHLGRTNVAYADGHAIPTAERYTETDPAEKLNIAENTGFLSPDNSAYDLR